MPSTPTTCARHPDVETRLRCSACDTPICPACGREAAVGFKCPDCAAQLEGTTASRQGSDRGADPRRRTGTGAAGPRRGAPRPARGSDPTDGRIPVALGARATVVGIVAAVAGGAVLGPVLQGGAFFLLSSGLVGWAVARAVDWATDGRDSPYLRALALTSAGFAVAVGLGFASAGAPGQGREIVFLAYPAAVYGGWMVVRRR